jgi:hypothetical protein
MFGTCAVLRMIGLERRSQVRGGRTVKYDAAVRSNGDLATVAAILANPNSTKLANPSEFVLDEASKQAALNRREQLVRAAAFIVAEIERLNYCEAVPPLNPGDDRWEILRRRQLPNETLRSAAERIYGGRDEGLLQRD